MKRLAFLLLCALAANLPSKAANIVFISFHAADNAPSANALAAGFTSAPDVGYTQLLTNNGHTVTRLVSLDNAALSAAVLNAADLVIISRSVPSGHYQADNETAFWNGITAPTMILGGYVIRGGTTANNVRLGYMATDTIPDTHAPIRLSVQLPGHPIFAGIALNNVGTMVNTYASSGTNGTILAPNNIAQRGISVITGATAGQGTVLATVAPGDPNASGRMVIAEWLAGASMNTTANGGPADTLAGHRLVLLTGTRENAGLNSEGSGIYDLTPDGAQLFLNAVNYMTSGRISIRQVNTVNNVNPGAGETSLLQAMTGLESGDYIRFNISGAGPHYIHTPVGGYPLITKNNVTIDGYTQPGAVPNTNPILAANNAQIKIVLTSTNGNWTLMDYNSNTNAAAGFGDSEFAILGIYGAINTHIKGLSLLGTRGAGVSHYAVAIARDAQRPVPGSQITGVHVSGCWIAVDPTWTPADLANGSSADLVFPFDDCIAAFSHRQELSYVFTNVCDGVTSVVTLTNRDPANRESDRSVITDYFAANPNCSPLGPVPRSVNLGNRIGHAGVILGVKAGAANPRSEFNVMLGGTINIIMEGQAFRISGNFLGVFPDGLHDYIPPFAELGTIAESHIEIGRGASDVVIGTDGDGVNDADERNVMGGVVTSGHSSQAGALNLGGYRHVIELYSLSGGIGPDRTRNRIAGNYIGVGVDGVKRFTNGVPAWNGSATGGSVAWVGSDFDGVSDAIEANVINNNYPPNLFYPNASGYNNAPSLGFFDEPSNGAIYSTRGNKLINNFPYPVNPARDNGNFIRNYVNKALATPGATYNDLLPVISPSSSTARLIGTVPEANATYPWTIIDVYTPDPEGIVNGQAVPDPNLPNGWVQGSNYLGSFVLGSAADRDSSASGFAFDICSLGLSAGTSVIISANYSQDPPGTHNARVLTSLFSAPQTLPNGIVITSITKSGGNVTINWCGGTGPYQLQKKANLSDPMWNNVGAPTAAFTATDAAGGGSGFYQVLGN